MAAPCAQENLPRRRFLLGDPSAGRDRRAAARNAPARDSTELKDFNDNGALPPPCGVRPVDTPGVSDRLENWKTCRISVGLASFVPPGIGVAGLGRRSSQRMRQLTGGGWRVHRWTADRRNRTKGATRTPLQQAICAVGEPPRPDVRSGFRTGILALIPSSGTVCAGRRSSRTREPRGAACALQDYSIGKIHDWPIGC